MQVALVSVRNCLASRSLCFAGDSKMSVDSDLADKTAALSLNGNASEEVATFALS